MAQEKAQKKSVEILSPAGSFDSLKAAVNAGADAVYAGGRMYGARAFAANFSDEELLRAIDYVHLYGKKLYLTVNTLMKQEELDQLTAYIDPLYRQGLDAVIVQDVGALAVLARRYPDMELHASTQMSVMSAEGAGLLKKLGVSRVVPGRELSLEEIRKICRTGIDVECFVHGAMCYSVSGQCLMSSMEGGRSGNRGQCAQPCRMSYRCPQGGGYVMSMKDICTIDQLPDLIEAGVRSFKIEGRMKKPEYVALVTSMYRAYADMYEQRPAVKKEDVEALQDIYNRGGFSKGYFQMHNGPEMISIDKPNHTGVAVLKILSVNQRTLTCRCLRSIRPQDVIDLSGVAVPGKKKADSRLTNYTFGREVHENETVRIPGAPNTRYEKGMRLFRTKNTSLINRIREELVEKTRAIGLDASVTLRPGQCARMTLTTGTSEVEVTVSGSVPVEIAKGRPLQAGDVERAAGRTGDPLFTIRSVSVHMEGDVFLPVKELKSVRRLALSRLQEEITGRHRRSLEAGMEKAGALPTEGETDFTGCGIDRWYSISVETKEQLACVRRFLKKTTAQGACRPHRVYVSFHCSRSVFPDGEAMSLVRELKEEGVSCYLSMPSLFREDAVRAYAPYFADGAKRIRQEFDGILVRSFDCLAFLLRIGYTAPLILDHNLYVMNRQAAQFYKELAGAKPTCPAELDASCAAQLAGCFAECVIYGYTPVMTSAQCAVKTLKGCTKKSETIYLERDHKVAVTAVCPLCYTVTYHHTPVYIADCEEELQRMGNPVRRISFTIEDEKRTDEILRRLADDFDAAVDEPFTRGRFFLGIY